MSAPPALLIGDDGREHTVDRRVQTLHHGMVLVQPAAVDPDDDLRPRRVQGTALQGLDSLAAHLSVQ